MSGKACMKLLNCRQCDDVLQLLPNQHRVCNCGAARGVETADGVEVQGSARVFTIDWEAYDGIDEHNGKMFRVLPTAQYRT